MRGNREVHQIEGGASSPALRAPVSLPSGGAPLAWREPGPSGAILASAWQMAGPNTGNRRRRNTVGAPESGGRAARLLAPADAGAARLAGMAPPGIGRPRRAGQG